MGDTASVPSHLLETVEHTVARAFTEAISACDASSSIGHIDDIRRQIRDALDAALAPPMRLHNARLSLQNRLPPEVWLNVWERLPLAARTNITHVCSCWRELAVNSPDVWTALECTIGQPLPPKDPTSVYSSLGLVAMALPRAEGRPLYLTISLHPVYMHGRVFDQLLAMLRPHAGEIVEMDIPNCSLLEFQHILGDLQPFSSMRDLRYAAVTLQPYGPFPPLFSRPRAFPHLKTIVLPAERQYYWGWDSTYFNGGGPVLCTREVPFPSVEMVWFAPAHEADIAQVLHDCPSLASLFLALTDFPWNSGSVDSMGSHDNGLTDLHLCGVRAEHIQDAMGLYRTHSSTQRFSVMLMDIPRITRVPDVPPGSSEMFHSYGWDSYIPPLPSTPSPPPFVHNDPPEPATFDGAQRTAPESRTRLGPKQLYKRLTESAKEMFRKRTPEAQPQPGPSDPRASQPVSPTGSIAQVPYPPSAAYEGTALAHLSEQFRDLSDPVDVVLCTTSDGWQSSPRTTHIALRATDAAGRTRTGGLPQGDSDAVPEFLAHVWRALHPRHIACEVELLPLLIASISETSPARSLEILFRTYHGPFGETAYCPMPAPMSMPQFPSLRMLRLAPRYADSAVPTVHSAGDIAAFVKGLGAEVPLENITICRGVVVENPGALREVADSIVLHADPSRGLFRVPSSQCT